MTAFVVIHPRLQSPSFRVLRTCSFIATGLSAFAPIIHAASIFPYHQLDRQAGLRYYYLEGIIVLIGAVIYIVSSLSTSGSWPKRWMESVADGSRSSSTQTRFPEAWRPGKFDIWGASHQIFHVLVVLSAMAHLYGILSAFQWNYENPRCPPAGP